MSQNEQPLSLIFFKSISRKPFDTWRVLKLAEPLSQGHKMNLSNFRLSNIVFPFGLNGFSGFFTWKTFT